MVLHRITKYLARHFCHPSWEIFRDTFAAWQADAAPRLGAAFAFYSVLSIVPLLLLFLSAASYLWDREAVQGQIVRQISGVLGAHATTAVHDVLATASQETHAGIVASILSFFMLVFSASGMFSELQTSLNLIWKTKRQTGQPLFIILRKKLFSFLMVLCSGILLLISVLTGAVIAAIGHYLDGRLPGTRMIIRMTDLLTSFGIVTCLFALTFKIVPNAPTSWRSVWIGGGFTAALFVIGKILIGLYLGYIGTTSAYGAAGSLVALLIWIYYSAQIFFFGAEFTYIYSLHRGERKRAAEP